MGQKLSLSELELYRRTDEVLHYLWDPIGVAGIPEARDEYHSYLPVVFSLVEKRDASAICAYLFHVLLKTSAPSCVESVTPLASIVA